MFLLTRGFAMAMVLINQNEAYPAMVYSLCILSPRSHSDIAFCRYSIFLLFVHYPPSGYFQKDPFKSAGEPRRVTITAILFFPNRLVGWKRAILKWACFFRFFLARPLFQPFPDLVERVPPCRLYNNRRRASLIP